MKKIWIVIVCWFVCGTSLSMRWPYPLGLLTDSYGIINADDLKEARRSYQTEPTNILSISESYDYWQCLPTDRISLNCEKLWGIDENGPVGQLNFWISDSDVTHHFITRRNFGVEDCEEWIYELKKVIAAEPMVCLSASFVALESQGDPGDFSPRDGLHYFWLLERAKSPAAKWSYFGYVGEQNPWVDRP